MQKKINNRPLLAIALIIFGLMLLLKQNNYLLFGPQFFNHSLLYAPLLFIGKSINFIFTWPVALIITGIILIAGNRNAGLLLMLAGVFFLLVKFIKISLLSLSFFIPFLLIAIGIVLIARASMNYKC